MPVHRYQVGDIVAGKYRLDTLLGEGGMGAVWGAFNLQLEAPVALKVLLNTERDHELLTQRLKQEAKAAAKLGHPAIVRVFDVGESEFGDPFIVMELLHGKSLATWLSEDGPLLPTRAVQLLLPIADALSLAHAKGIVHRDLKPDNVFVCTDNELLEPKLVDFGIVKIAGPTSEATHLTQVGTVVGSPDYMSPEQARGRDDVDARSDIWSFCVMLYELVAGTTPFAAPNYNALLVSIITDEPRALPVSDEADAELWSILQRGLHKDRAERFQTMADLGRALAAWLLKQGFVQDACGGSLEAKWIFRSSDASALRASRGSLPSIPTLPPDSGVRPAPSDLGTARTHAAPSLSPASLPAPTVAPRAAAKRVSPAVFGLALGVAVVLVGSALWLAFYTPTPRPHSASVSQPAKEAVLAPLTTPAPEVKAAPSIESPSIEATRVESPNVEVIPAATASFESKSRAPAPRVRQTSPEKTAPEKPPASDLLAPY